ncbi:MAG TPA: hypothetical protein VIJ86_11490 [Acidimicrobiales bacterium]
MSTSPRTLVSVSAYACEGGLDRHYEPATCYSPTIALGRHPGPGAAEGLWESYEEVLDLAADVGVTGVCLEVSWARLEPRRGERDHVALDRYRAVLAHARRRGLWVSVAAVDAAWPAWLGLEAWLMPWVTPVAIDYVNWLASSLEADALNVFAARELLTRGFLDDASGPPWRRGATEDAVSAAQNLDDIGRAVRAASSLEVATHVNLELDDAQDGVDYDVDEVHLRSLVRGTGPLCASRGLVARRGDQWVVADESLVEWIAQRA